MTRFAFLTLPLLWIALPVHAQPLGDSWGTAEAEAEFYRIVDLPIPEELAIETGSFDVLPDGRLAIGTRRGDIYLVSGAFDRRPELRFHRFARGLDEIFGLGYRDGAFYVTQQTEVTRITDLNGDGRADRFETLGDDWLTPDLFRFGASTLLNDVLMQITKLRTGAYQSADYYTLD